jgi:hypothetical protein
MTLRSALAAGVFALIASTVLQAKTVELAFADNRTDVFLNMGDTLVVELSSGEVNGFRWVSHLPKASALTALNEEELPADKNATVPVKIARFRFNAASVVETALVFGFETAVKVAGAAPQDASAYSVRVHVAAGSPQLGTAILLGTYKGTLPCADCIALDTVLRLYAKGSTTRRMRFTFARRPTEVRRMEMSCCRIEVIGQCCVGMRSILMRRCTSSSWIINSTPSHC